MAAGGQNGPANRAGDVDDPGRQPEPAVGQDECGGFSGEVGAEPTAIPKSAPARTGPSLSPVADHGHHPLCRPQAMQDLSLRVGREAGLDMGDANGCRNAPAGTATEQSNFPK
jgi:hypothetical protein